MIFKCLHSPIDELCPLKIIMFKVKLLIKAQLPLWILTHTVGSAILDDPRVFSFCLCNQDSLILSSFPFAAHCPPSPPSMLLLEMTQVVPCRFCPFQQHTICTFKTFQGSQLFIAAPLQLCGFPGESFKMYGSSIHKNA